MTFSPSNFKGKGTLTSGQVSHTYVPLSPSSITWYLQKLGSIRGLAV